MASFSSDLFQFDEVIRPTTYRFTSLAIVAAGPVVAFGVGTLRAVAIVVSQVAAPAVLRHILAIGPRSAPSRTF